MKQGISVMGNRFSFPVLLVSLFCIAEVSSAQDAVVVSPELYTVLFENDDIRVMELTYQPGEGDAPHSHPKYMGLVLEGGSLRVHHDGGESEELVVEGGQMLLFEPVEQHWAENIGDTVFRAILIEYKH
jgi:quercetin dioxygenase-like cupin family protein